jgi:hypothetical protein
MKNIVLIAPLRVAGSICCRVPGCPRRACSHVDMYMGEQGDRNWDARSSGPYCSVHLAKLESTLADTEVRQVRTSLIPDAVAIGDAL